MTTSHVMSYHIVSHHGDLAQIM